MNIAIKNQWTLALNASNKPQENTWQIGYYEKEGITFLGIFDHLLVDDEHTTGLEEGGGWETEAVDHLMIDGVKSLIPNNDYIYAQVLLRLSDPQSKYRPSNISKLNWFFTSRKNKYATIVSHMISQDGLTEVSPVDKDWYTTIYLGKNLNLVDKYFSRLGRNPDAEADILYLSHSEIDFMIPTGRELFNSVIRKSFANLTADDVAMWKKILKMFPTIIWAIDGHIYCATDVDSKENLFKQIKSVADKYKLKISTHHLLR